MQAIFQSLRYHARAELKGYMELSAYSLSFLDSNGEKTPGRPAFSSSYVDRILPGSVSGVKSPPFE